MSSLAGKAKKVIEIINNTGDFKAAKRFAKGIGTSRYKKTSHVSDFMFYACIDLAEKAYNRSDKNWVRAFDSFTGENSND
jgi:hypothetical protein